MFNAQSTDAGTNPPQLDALDAGTDVVTLQVNYAAILPHTGSLGCWPQVPIAFSDVSWLRAKQVELNAMLATQAAANGANLVDAYAASAGHDACKSSGTRWVEPLVAGNTAAPFHPNLNGMTGIAAVVATEV